MSRGWKDAQISSEILLLSNLPPDTKKETQMNSALKAVVLSSENRVSENDFFKTLMISASPSWLTLSLFTELLSFLYRE